MSQLLEIARTSGTPIIEHTKVTFLWEGDQAPVLIADFTDWEEEGVQLTRAGEKTWIHEVELPSDAYIEYAFLDAQSDERVSDPYNPRTVPNGVGDVIITFKCRIRRPIRLSGGQGVLPGAK